MTPTSTTRSMQRVGCGCLWFVCVWQASLAGAPGVFDFPTYKAVARLRGLPPTHATPNLLDFPSYKVAQMRTLVNTPKSSEQATGLGGPIIGGRCGLAFYRASAVLWSCEQQQAQNRFAVPANSKLAVVQVPKGVKDLEIQLSSPGKISMRITKGSGKGAQLIFGDYRSSPVASTPERPVANWMGITVRVGGEVGAESASFEGALPAALTVTLVSESNSEQTANFLVSHKGLVECPPAQAPIGCRPFDEDRARAHVNQWACWIASRFSPVEASWTTFGENGDEAGSGIPWSHFGDVWDKYADAPGETEWLSAFRYLDRDEDMHVTQVEFLAGVALCPNAPTMQSLQAEPVLARPIEADLPVVGRHSELNDEDSVVAMAGMWKLIAIVAFLVVASAGVLLLAGSFAEGPSRYSLLASISGMKADGADPEAKLGQLCRQLNERSQERSCTSAGPVGPWFSNITTCAGWRARSTPASSVAPAPVPTAMQPAPQLKRAPPVPTATQPAPQLNRPMQAPSSAPRVARTHSATAALPSSRAKLRRGSSTQALESSQGHPAETLPVEVISGHPRPRDRRDSVADRFARPPHAPVPQISVTPVRRPVSPSPQTPHPEAEPAFHLEIAPPCPQDDDGRHAMEFTEGSCTLYNCMKCHSEKAGLRWHCREHHLDICTFCKRAAQEEAKSNESELPASAPTLERAIEALRANGRGHAANAAQACRMLSTIVKEDSERQRALRMDAPAAIIQAMRADAGDELLQFLGCTALRSMCAGPDVSSAAMVAASGGVEVVLQAVDNFPGSVNVSEAACLVIRLLALDQESRKAVLRERGDVAVVNATARHGSSPGMQEAGFLALCNLTLEAGALCDPEFCRETVAMVIRGMSKHADSEAVQEAGILALYNCIATAKCFEVVREFGGVDVVRAAIARHPALVDSDEANAIAQDEDEDQSGGQ